MIIAGLAQPDSPGGLLVIGLSAKDALDMQDSDGALFYSNINGSIGLLKDKPHNAMVIVRGETDDEVIGKIKKYFELAGRGDAEFHVIHNHGRKGEK